MAHLAKRILATACALAMVTTAWGFSLRGPAGPWMTDRLGYRINNNPLFGPMVPGEEYRMDVPQMYYGFTPAFMNFFGTRGAAEIDKAFKILNDLPVMNDDASNDAWETKLSAYPLSSTRVNQRALALGILDIKSIVLGQMMEQMGLADPTRFVFTLRNRWTTTAPDTTNYYIIRRNYDPDTWQASSYINGTLWTYPAVIDELRPGMSFVMTEPVDPLAYLGLLNMPVSARFANLLQGQFYTRLTRDDVGGLYYLYRKHNYNVETLSPSALAGGGVWDNPGSIGTNTTGTNALGTNTLVQTAIRGGRGKVSFARVDYDPLMGFFTPFTNSYTDTYVTNGMAFKQYLQRAVTTPDILFDAADLQGGDGNDVIFLEQISDLAWIASGSATNGTSTNAGVHLGPGTIPPGFAGPTFTLTFNTVSEIYWNTFPFDNQDELTAAKYLLYGSFDGTTNAPFVYPIGREVREVEQQVLERDRGIVWGQP